MKILYKLTTRSRPAKATRAIKSIVENCDDCSNDILIVSVDNDDETYSKIDFSCCSGRLAYDIPIGEGGVTKIQAINRDVPDYHWDILVNLSDDQLFIAKGFDSIIRDAFKDSLDRFVHFPDGNRTDLCTMSIIGKDYFMRDKYIYWHEYASEYCDNEAQEVAKIRGCYRFVNQHIFNHLHPNYGNANNDNLYMINQQRGFINYDVKIYTQRKINNFFI